MQMMSQQGAGPQSYVGALERMPIEALLQEFNNPGSQFPKFAVLSAMQKKQEQQRMMQAMQGQQAMAQQAQAGPPIAQGVLAGAQQMAAQDQQVPAYNAGGIVALSNGGVSGLQDPEKDEQGLPRTNEERERILRNNRIFLEQKKNADALKQRQAQLAAVRETSQPVPEQLSKFYRSTGRDKPVYLGASTAPDIRTQLNRADAAVRSAAADLPTPSSSPRPSAGAGGAARPSATAAAPVAAQDPFAAYEKAQKDWGKQRLEGAKTPAEVEAARAEEKRLMEENLRQAMAEAKAARESAEARRERAVGAAKRSILEDPEALLRLAGGMSRKRGEGIGSLAAGAGAELGRRREAIEKAEEKFAGEQKELRTLDAANRQYNISIAQLQRAIAEGNAEKIRVAQQDVADAGVKLQEAKLEYGLKARDTESRATQARAAMISAGKPSGQETLISFFNKDPEGFKRFIAAQAEPKNEASLAKALVVEAVKNPVMLNVIKEQNPELYNLMQQEIIRAGGGNYGVPPAGAVREKGK